ncbi:hypothetical protein G6F50_014894 [Rhizopus delemar]|uniref:Uncharacterized protein n=1 Tax=Rhizopus delemar TaxID=936053 RepID=A0A9P6Y2M7_9FUNG|nr:hypothetical protein G6F50_014894 [Rhizopus delemar]
MAAVGNEIGAFAMVHAFEAHFMAADHQLLARCQRHFTLHVQCFHQQGASQEQRDAGVGDDHAEHLGGEAAVAAQPLPDETRGTEPDPGRRGHAEAGLPAILRRLPPGQCAEHDGQCQPRCPQREGTRGLVALPLHQWAERQQQDHRCHQQQEQAAEVGRTDRDLAQRQRIGQQRVQRAQEHHRAGGGQQQVVGQQQGFARGGGEATARIVGVHAQLAGAQRIQQQAATDQH